VKAHWILRALERVTWDASIVAIASVIGMAILFVALLGSL
jgi:hypothetical protein